MKILTMGTFAKGPIFEARNHRMAVKTKIRNVRWWIHNWFICFQICLQMLTGPVPTLTLHKIRVQTEDFRCLYTVGALFLTPKRVTTDRYHLETFVSTNTVNILETLGNKKS